MVFFTGFITWNFGLWKLLRNFYTNVKCAVNVNGVTSKWFLSGCPSRSLYCVFLKGLLKDLRDLYIGCTMLGIFTRVVCQADA